MRGMWLLLLLTVSACSEQDDLRQYVVEVRSRPATAPEPIPTVSSYFPEPYAPVSQRSPFVAPRPEGITSQTGDPRRCARPDAGRDKHPLERYSLESLSMRGTLQNGGIIRALISTPDGATHPVKTGDRLGFNQGEITAITREQVALTEYVPDGRGCWMRRETALSLVISQ
ncbi:pilus assembly protein PilP [Oceanimonas baumannii]|uniref:pilus assembly protein PilP n=1 Tax=Oceanimonas baumannii TaxID=129578 RepID=UPI001D18A84B|nr:pilus assembly protein PilP [Oceanimonas baumannii]MCC4266051.1 pilus assembly protein PilP [Oceanimonas baumannii]